MNKSELLKFSVEARRDLIEKISRKAEQYGITEDNQELNMKEEYGQLIVNDRSFPVEKRHALNTLQGRLRAIGYHQLIEEAAYTWFNRIIAIRYMEVNNYLPDKVNVLSSATGKSEPDILSQYETMNIDVNHEEINEFMRKGENEQAYRRLFIAQCNALNRLLPTLFEEIEDYAELLLPDYLLDQESIIFKIVNDLSDNNFYETLEDGTKKDNVEVLGWLYQYYMSERKEKVGGLKNTAVKKEDLPVVTQLFTPKWIVQYMLQNSLGKLYDEKYEDNQLAKHWEYYLKHEENHHLYPEFESLEDLKIMDPACGSGHILVYAFDMLYDMYEEAGYPSREIPQLILEKNLYGLDIDKRAQQIANFALLMKAAEKQPRFISRLSRRGTTPKLNVYEIIDADKDFPEELIDFFVKDETEKALIVDLLVQFENGKQFGSLITPVGAPYEEWINRIHELGAQPQDLIEESYAKELKAKLLPVIKQAFLLQKKYDVVVTNPPYHSKYNPTLKKFIFKYYSRYKTDLYSAFISKTKIMTRNNGYSALMTPLTWMFISFHEKLRESIIDDSTISSLIQLEYSAFKDATVPICTFVIHNQAINTIGEYIRLSEYKDDQSVKVKESIKKPDVDYRYSFQTSEFIHIPGSPIAYWISGNVVKLFSEAKYLGDLFDVKAGVRTGTEHRFIRYWFEVEESKIGFNLSTFKEIKTSGARWFPLNKGGAFCRWYGNYEYVINLYNDAEDIKKHAGDHRLRNPEYYFKENITWSKITSSKISFRYSEQGQIFGDAGPAIFISENDSNFGTLLGLLSSKVTDLIMSIINPTLNLPVTYVSKMPIILPESNHKREINKIVTELIKIAKKDWDEHELSWNFKTHSLIKNYRLLSESYRQLEGEKFEEQSTLLNNEERLNKIFIELYGLEGELSPNVSINDISVSEVNRRDEAASFLSYFIGCLIGRYSLTNKEVDTESQIYSSRNGSFNANQNGLILLTEKHYFDDDIIVCLKEFLSYAFSKETVTENIEWIAESLKMKKGEVPEDRIRRYFLDEFFKDHCQTYKKRPIYWLVDSGRQKGLRTLVYMHRYQEDTMATIRFEHLQEIQGKYQNEIDMIDTRIVNPSLTATDKRNLERSRTVYQRKIEELQEFDKHLATYANLEIPIDLDDGVKVNYAKFDKILAKIR